MRTFRTLRTWLAPRWLTTGEGQLLGYALDLVKDSFVQRAYLGLLARLPQNDPTGATTAPPDALAAMGRDRRVVRGISDTDATYAARLLLWLDDRKTCGNPFTLMRQLAGYCGSTASFRTVDNSGNWYSRSAAGVETSSIALANWNWDGKTALWSRFWVIIYPGGLWTAETSLWGGGGATWGEAGTLGTTATQEQIAKVLAIIEDWKPAGTQGAAIIAIDPLTFVPTAPEPDGLWGKFYKYVGGTAVISRLTTGRYLGA